MAYPFSSLEGGQSHGLSQHPLDGTNAHLFGIVLNLGAVPPHSYKLDYNIYQTFYHKLQALVVGVKSQLS